MKIYFCVSDEKLIKKSKTERALDGMKIDKLTEEKQLTFIPCGDEISSLCMLLKQVHPPLFPNLNPTVSIKKG